MVVEVCEGLYGGWEVGFDFYESAKFSCVVARHELYG